MITAGSAGAAYLAHVNALRCSGFARSGDVRSLNSHLRKFPEPDVICCETGSRSAHAGCGCGVCMPIEIPRKRECFFPNFPNTEPGNRLSRQADSNYNGCVSEACKGGMLSRRPNSDPGPRFNGSQNCQIAGTRPDRVPAAALAQAGSGGARFSCEAAPPGFSPRLRKLQQGRAGNLKTGYSIIWQVTPWGSSTVATLT